MSERLTTAEKEEMGAGIIGFFIQGINEALTEPHKFMLRAICELYANGDKVTIPSVATQLRYDGKLEEVGGLEAIVKIHQDFIDQLDSMQDDDGDY